MYVLNQLNVTEIRILFTGGTKLLQPGRDAVENSVEVVLRQSKDDLGSKVLELDLHGVVVVVKLVKVAHAGVHELAHFAEK
jgi:hypothetical protein